MKASLLTGSAFALVLAAAAIAQPNTALTPTPSPDRAGTTSGTGTHARTTHATAAAASSTTHTPATPAPQPQHDARLAMAIPDAHGYHRVVTLRALDKITGRAVDLSAPAGRAVKFATLSIVARFCHTAPPEEAPESSAFLQIQELKPGDPPVTLFSGWMFASSPSINGLEHPVYDVWVTGCISDEPAPPPPAPPVVTRAVVHAAPTVPSDTGPAGTPPSDVAGTPGTPPNGATEGAEIVPQPDTGEETDDQVGSGSLPSH